MSSQSIPLADGTMVSRYEFSGTVSHTVFRYLPDGSREEITAFFSREELPDPDSTDPCPFYTVNGEETDPDTFYARLQERITDKMLPSSAWTEV